MCGAWGAPRMALWWSPLGPTGALVAGQCSWAAWKAGPMHARCTAVLGRRTAFACAASWATLFLDQHIHNEVPSLNTSWTAHAACRTASRAALCPAAGR